MINADLGIFLHYKICTYVTQYIFGNICTYKYTIYNYKSGVFIKLNHCSETKDEREEKSHKSQQKITSPWLVFVIFNANVFLTADA